MSVAANGEIRSEKLLKELAEYWKQLGGEDEKEAVLRACSMTLLVATTGEDDVQELSGTLADLMHSHPSRYVVLRIVERDSPSISARVFAQCHMAFGRRQQICCEQIEFTATRDRLADFYSAALGLTVPDLPVMLWLKDARLLPASDFEPVLGLARSVLLDSAQMEDAAAGLGEMNARRAKGWRIKDLNWTRLTGWRETIAKTFEGHSCRERLEGITGVEVEGAGQGLGTDVAYLASWLGARLPGAKVEARGKGASRVRFHDPGGDIEVLLGRDAMMEVSFDGNITRVPAAVLSQTELMEEELSILGADPVYDATLPDAARFAAT